MKSITLALLATLLAAGIGHAQQLTLIWQDKSSNEKGFEVERAGAEAGPFATMATVAENVETYQDAAITKSALFCYRVRAWAEEVINSQAQKKFSGYSNVACARLEDAPGDPVELQLSEAQEAIGRAQEQLGIAQHKIARVQQHK